MTTDLIATVCQKFSVAGMSCRHCELAVSGELGRLDGVTSVTVDLATGTVVTESVAPLGIDAVAAAVDEAGYELVAPAPRTSPTGTAR